MTRFVCFLAGTLLMFLAPARLQADDELVLGGPEPGKITTMGFQLDQPCRIQITGKGGSFEGFRVHSRDKKAHRVPLVFYAWILNSETREPVWHTFKSAKQRHKKRYRGLFEIDESVNLRPGHYEVYYAAAPDMGTPACRKTCRRVKYRNKHRKQLEIMVTGHVLKADNGRGVVDQLSEEAIIALPRQGNDQSHWQDFCLKSAASIRIYAQGEGNRKTQGDYAWIVNADNNSQVWSLSERRSQGAGGAEKNLRVDETVTLAKGRYRVHYVSDQSHSFDGWNDLPPNDPQFWGVTLWASSKKDRRRVSHRSFHLAEPVVELVRAGNNTELSRGFRLNRDMDLRLLCLGEGTARGGFRDGGWIIDANTREKVWSMDYEWSQSAGGAERNRLVDQVIRLPKGEYIAYYATDDNHAYAAWDEGKPYDPARWGLSLWTVRKSDAYGVATFSERSLGNKHVLAQIVGIGDHDYRRTNFTVPGVTHLRIQALGEGERGSMTDYGWIENRETGRVYWEMTYRKTDHAGGAKKNRAFNDIIVLPKGDYRLIYKSDGSHSSQGWNASPPDDRNRYGITILQTD